MLSAPFVDDEHGAAISRDYVIWLMLRWFRQMHDLFQRSATALVQVVEFDFTELHFVVLLMGYSTNSATHDSVNLLKSHLFFLGVCAFENRSLLLWLIELLIAWDAALLTAEQKFELLLPIFFFLAFFNAKRIWICQALFEVSPHLAEVELRAIVRWRHVCHLHLDL